MKSVIEVIRKEDWIPYVELVLLVMFFGNYGPIVSLLQNHGVNIVENTLWGVGLILCIPLLYVAGKHDSKNGKYVKDEREVLQDAHVGDIGYHTAVFGLATYLCFVHFDILLVGLLALVFAVRLFKRYELETA